MMSARENGIGRVGGEPGSKGTHIPCGVERPNHWVRPPPPASCEWQAPTRTAATRQARGDVWAKCAMVGSSTSVFV